MVVEELRNPERTVPVSLVVSLGAVTTLYVLTNAAYLAVLSPAEVLSSPAIAVTFGEKAFGVLAFSVPVLVALSTVGSLNGQIFAQSRVAFCGARLGHLPAWLALISVRNCTPVPAVIVMTGLTLLLLVTSDLYALINYVSFAHSLARLLVTSGLLWLRYRRPGWRRPFKVWLLVPVVYLGVTVLLVVLPLIQEPVVGGIAVGVVALGGVLYYIKCRCNITSSMQHCSHRVYRFVQILFEVLPEKK